MNLSLWFIKHLHQQGIKGNGDKTPTILNLGMPWSLTPCRKNIMSHFVGPRKVGTLRWREKYLAPIRIKPRFLGRWGRRLVKNGKGFLYQARCGPEGSRTFRLPDFHDIRHMKLMRLSVSRTGRLYPQEMSLVLIFTRGWVDLRAMVRSEGNMSLKNPVTPSGIDPGTVRLVAQPFNHYPTSGSDRRLVLEPKINFIYFEFL